MALGKRKMNTKKAKPSSKNKKPKQVDASNPSPGRLSSQSTDGDDTKENAALDPGNSSDDQDDKTRTVSDPAVSPATAEDPAAATADKEAAEDLFKGSETVEDSVLDGYYCIQNMDGFEKWIRERKSTLCKPPLDPKKKVLVLDLDNTLICRDKHPYEFIVDCNNGCRYPVSIHPACIAFLHEMKAHYSKIAIYTSSSAVYASKICDKMTTRYLQAYPDNKTPFFTIMSANDCPSVDGMRSKDLLLFGSLEDVVFVDDDPYYSFRSQNDNVIHVRRYHGEKSQEGGLMAIAPLLTYLSSVKSVPDTMRKLKKVWHNAGLVKIVQCVRGVTC
ncbi:hypothetical protein PtA15_6A472 [Puccinia triticina]|uniref:Mitochondrial import inner membrane translocase subunit TIM50 n=1 Tax=Puccinia triticina TaxID=208348 RepID=A0ABY7CNB9_9BASI|nr:uncharacterized protein PtA15_6A472 [Puccinia triticina]WAQ85843.1 hypothetical protein PtA15_6A472 [Puccinia triticina]